MAGYFKEAQRHVEQIKYFYDNAGSRGYDQAVYHFNELTGLIFKAMKSKRYKDEVPLINSIKKDMQTLMDEMKNRKKDQDTEN